MITIEHTRETGTIAVGTARNDAVEPNGETSGDVLRRHGFRWARSLSAWYIPNSRDKVAKEYQINAAVAVLQRVGFQAEASIDNTESRTVAEVEADKAARVAERAERLSARAERTRASGVAHCEASDAITEHIPMGQPILVGHHSERRHRRALERSWNHLSKGVAEIREGERLAESAKTAAGYESSRNHVPTVMRRIERLSVELRKWQRNVATSTSADYQERAGVAIADLTAQIAHWQGVVEQAAASGVKVWSKADFVKGDYVLFHSTWYEVVRVNAKSVTIPAMINDGAIVHKDGNRCTWTDTIGYDKVRGRKSAAEIAELEAKVAAS